MDESICKNCGHYRVCKNESNYRLLCPDYIEPVLHGKWISCAEKLPEETGRYLVCDRLDERVRIEYFYASCNLGWAGAQAYKITHWMPLPEPPKGE